jgi:hypothetical protein
LWEGRWRTPWFRCFLRGLGDRTDNSIPIVHYLVPSTRAGWRISWFRHYPGLYDGRAESTLIGIHESGRTKVRRKIRRKEGLSEAFFMSRLPFAGSGQEAASHKEFRAQRQNPNLFCISRRKDSAPREPQSCMGPLRCRAEGWATGHFEKDRG